MLGPQEQVCHMWTTVGAVLPDLTPCGRGRRVSMNQSMTDAPHLQEMYDNLLRIGRNKNLGLIINLMTNITRKYNLQRYHYYTYNFQLL